MTVPYLFPQSLLGNMKATRGRPADFVFLFPRQAAGPEPGGGGRHPGPGRASGGRLRDGQDAKAPTFVSRTQIFCVTLVSHFSSFV